MPKVKLSEHIKDSINWYVNEKNPPREDDGIVVHGTSIIITRDYVRNIVLNVYKNNIEQVNVEKITDQLMEQIRKEIRSVEYAPGIHP